MHAAALIRSVGAELCRPWPRHILAERDWPGLIAALANDPLVLLGLWADARQVHAMFLDPADAAVLPVSVPVDGDAYPALSATRPEAAPYERMVRELWGFTARGADRRAWLDHGRWPVSVPLAPRPMPPEPGDRPEFRMPDDAMQMPIGPQWGLIEEAAHLRLAVRDGRVLRAEALLGYAHKGTLALMRGKPARAAARFAARLAAEQTVAHAIAFAQATEAALDVTIPDRALVLRVAMAETERVAGHLADLGAQAGLADAAGMATPVGVLREQWLRAAGAAFGHRLMMDCVVPGGIAADIEVEGRRALLRMVAQTAAALPALKAAHDDTSLGARLVGLGMVPPARAITAGAGGVTGRASGRDFDARDFLPLYHEVKFRRAAGTAGDAAARTAVRLAEIEESLRLLGIVLDRLPAGPVSVPLPSTSGEGIGCAESIRGDVWHWIRLDHGQVAAAFPRDPGWALWPVLEAVLEGEAVENVALIRCSLGLPGSGVDL